MADTSEILFDKINDWGIVELNRPRALNALNLNMVRAFSAKLDRWEKDQKVKGVIIKGTGRAFCAGGDVHALFYIAILNGITMGGGAGLSLHGAYRIVTKNTLFAMPETGIGFFPDVGGTYFLPRLPGQMGMFLGLSGFHIGPSDMILLGLATNYVPSEKISALESSLINCHLHHSACEEVGPIIKSFSEDPDPALLSEYQDIINRCFSEDSVEEIIFCLKEKQSDWAKQIDNNSLPNVPPV